MEGLRMNKEAVAKMIDHTMLKATTTDEDIRQLCMEAKEYNFMSVCVVPYYVAYAYELLKDTSVKVCTVVGFPLGANTTATKAFEATQAVKEGALEVDMVINVGAVKSAQWEVVKSDIQEVAKSAKAVNKEAIVKVIIETCYLTREEKLKVSEIILETDADYVKTSTGFGTGGATIEDVALIKGVVANKKLIKASGGVRNYDDVVAMAKVGANRIGTSGGVAIISGADSKTAY
jgi:deoxyribose-phosphate aldolase